RRGRVLQTARQPSDDDAGPRGEHEEGAGPTTREAAHLVQDLVGTVALEPPPDLPDLLADPAHEVGREVLLRGRRGHLAELVGDRGETTGQPCLLRTGLPGDLRAGLREQVT